MGAQTTRETMMLGCVEIAGVLVQLAEWFISQGKPDYAELSTEKKNDQLVCVCASVCLCMYSFIPALSSRLSDLIFSTATGGL